MHAVVMRMQDTPYVLKGGTALAFAYDLDRHSTDIDFDAEEPVYIKTRVREGLGDAGVLLSAWIVAKDSGLGQRFKVHYARPRVHEDHLLNLDLSFRSVPKPGNVAVVRGIRTYRIEALFEQKLRAGERRTTARDLFDLAFIAERYGSKLPDASLRRAEIFSRDYDLLADEYGPAFQSDPILSRITTAGERALTFRMAIEEQLMHRSATRADQEVPFGESFAQALAGHRIWCETDGREGRRAELRDLDFRNRSICGINLDHVILVRPDFTNADLRNATLRGAVLREATFDGTDLTGVDATGVELPHVSLRNTRMGPTTVGIAEALAKEYQRESKTRPVPTLQARERERDRSPRIEGRHGPAR